MSPAVRFWDTAEITAAAYSLGIPHAPGFPIYILLGRVFTVLLPFKPAIAVNLLSVVSATAAVVLALLIFRELEEGVETIGGYLSALLFAFGNCLWAQAGRAEVYAFNMLLIEISMLCMLRFSRMGDKRLFIAGIYFWGLSAAMHSASAAAAFIPVIWAGLRRQGWKNIDWKTLSLSVLGIIVALSSYTYLLLRSPLIPEINWGRAETFTALWNMVSAHEFAFSIELSSFKDLVLRLNSSLKLLNASFTFISLPILVVGLIRWRYKGFLFAAYILGLFIAFIRQELPQPNHMGYILICSLILSLWSGSGLNGLRTGLKKISVRFNWKTNLANWVSVIIIGLVIVPLFLVQFPRSDLSGSRWAEKMGYDMLDDLPQGTILLMNDFSAYFICRYLQVVENVSTDYDIILPGLLSEGSKSKHWYLKELEDRTTIQGLEHAQGTEIAVIAKIVEANHTNRPVFCEYGEDFRPFANYLQPQGLLFRIVLDSTITRDRDDDYSFPKISDFKRDRGAALAYAERAFARGLYYNDIGNLNKANEYFSLSAYLTSGR